MASRGDGHYGHHFSIAPTLIDKRVIFESKEFFCASNALYRWILLGFLQSYWLSAVSPRPWVAPLVMRQT